MWEALIGVCALLFLNLVVVIFYYGKMVQKVDSFDYPKIMDEFKSVNEKLTRHTTLLTNHLPHEMADMKENIKALTASVHRLEVSIGNMQTMLKMHMDEKG